MNVVTVAVGKDPCNKTRRYTRRQLHKAALAQRKEARLEAKAHAGDEGRLERSARRLEVPFKGVDLGRLDKGVKL